jgi:hypothetical protein
MGMLSRVKLTRLSAGWFWFWAAALLVLPNCTFSVVGVPSLNNLDRGSPPRTAAVFCDIELERRCATAMDLAMGTRLASAAVALVAGQEGTTIGLDYSPAKVTACGGVPEAVVFHDAFPRGTSVCLNCGEVIPALHMDAAAICQARCYDLTTTMADDGTIIPEKPPTAETVARCATNARVSTNFPLNSCFEGACSMEGTLRLDFMDPRWIPEPVEWDPVTLNGVSAAGGTLIRTAPTTGFSDAGASSSQLIAGGDAFLEFTATETNTARTAGLSTGPPPPGFITFPDIGFGLLLMDTAEIIALENGLSVGTFGLYTAGEKFRLKLTDNLDGTATVSYSRLIGSCTDGKPCNETVFHTSANAITYPVRVDAMFREQNGTVTQARIAYIR